ncbi:MAG: shikimate kinase [Gammaproteobacteria bacterium]
MIGLPGAGKTTVGRLLADELDWKLFDCDAAFEAEAGAAIADWVAEHGWSAFREREGEILVAVLALDRCVISTGGGAVEDKKNRDALAVSATVVWLDAPPEVLAARVDTAKDRPLLAQLPGPRLAELARWRNPLYAALADIRVDATVPASEVAARIVGSLR